MFEYTNTEGKRLTINPKMICAISEGVYKDECYIFVCNNSDPFRVKASYEKVNMQFQRYDYQVQTVVTM